MKTNDQILENFSRCTIEEDIDLDVKENFYYKYEDVVNAMNELRESYVIHFKPHFPDYWPLIKNVIDTDGWVYSNEVPHLLDYYFSENTGIEIEFEKMYEGEWRGSRWRPKSILKK